jgi:hypothetical protein
MTLNGTASRIKRFGKALTDGVVVCETAFASWRYRMVPEGVRPSCFRTWVLTWKEAGGCKVTTARRHVYGRVED